jgi:hypothetical protein
MSGQHHRYSAGMHVKHTFKFTENVRLTSAFEDLKTVTDFIEWSEADILCVSDAMLEKL